VAGNRGKPVELPVLSQGWGEGWGKIESNEREERGCDDFSITDRQSDVLFAGDRVDRVDGMGQGRRHQTGALISDALFLFA
jgi:hypothetical protein